MSMENLSEIEKMEREEGGKGTEFKRTPCLSLGLFTHSPPDWSNLPSPDIFVTPPLNYRFVA